jgi:ABC-2 type transport system ATP-binding protein
MKRWGCIAATALMWAALPGVARAEDLVVRSFDGTRIVAHWFPNPSLGRGERAPVVLNGPGWSQPGEDDPSRGAIKRLHGWGYNVLTWDPRGFGVSGGEASIDAPQTEGRDVKALVSLMARQPEVRLDRRGDPRVGMTGGSYGGGIQLSTAGIDRRIDAIVPVVAWHSLETSLYKDRTFKQGWGSLLYGSGLAAAGAHGGGLDPHIISAFRSATSTGVLSPSDVSWFRRRGPGDAIVRRITAPTMLVGGTVDTLFPLDEDVRNYRLLKASGTPVKMLWFCGGHGQCAEGNGGEKGAGLDVDTVTGSGRGDPRVEAATRKWLARYLRGRRRVRTGPEFEFRSDDRRYRAAPQYPVAPLPPLVERGSGVLSISPGATSGGAITAAPVDSGALEVPVVVPRRSQLLGAPRVRLEYRGTGTPAHARVYAQLVSVDRGVVVGNQAIPIPVRLDGRPHQVSRSLVPIASTARAGARYVLQLVAGTALWADQRARGELNASEVEISMPVADPRGLGAHGRRCTTDRSVVVRLAGQLRGRLVGGRVMLRGRRIGLLGPGVGVVRVRFARGALGEQRLQLVLRLAGGRTMVQRRTVVLCG